ncbi:cytochrome P450 [Cristinia sonorae]|uniref:Cytochrome P450 n=1 Tax=Cristinia sonorae TaxID=1940300 RepID=A0A8K0XLK3_9AGAR|nr:cytochrome P450 [Cristinia sonorae]
MVTMWLQVFTNILLGLGLYVIFRKLTDMEAEGSYGDVDGPPNDHWFAGIFGGRLHNGLNYILRNTEIFGTVWKYAARYWAEALIVSDPLALHYILIKDQDSFEVADAVLSGNSLAFGPGLISIAGDQHRKQRKILGPLFSMSNMQDLLPALQPVVDKVRASITAQVSQHGGQPVEIDIPGWLSRASIEYIAQAGMGQSFDLLDSDYKTQDPSDFVKAVKQLRPLHQKLAFFQPIFRLIARYLSPYWWDAIAKWLPLPDHRKLRWCINVLHTTSKKALLQRKADIKLAHETRARSRSRSRSRDKNEEQFLKIRGKDIMTSLLVANSTAHEAERLSDGEILAQMSTFLFAGFDTTTDTLNQILYTLALDDHLQARLRGEIRKAKQEYATFQAELEEDDSDVSWENVELPYDVLLGLPLLDAVFHETLRMYPPVTEITRVAQEDTNLPLQFPIHSKSGIRMKTVPIPKGTPISISILGANYNKDIWGDDAYDFKPDRWLTDGGEFNRNGEKTHKRRASRARKMQDDDASHGSMRNGSPPGSGAQGGMKYPGIYSSIMSFGGGNRACIGFRFAEMQITQMLVTLLSTLHFSLPYDAESSVKSSRSSSGPRLATEFNGSLNVRLVREDDFITL